MNNLRKAAWAAVLGLTLAFSSAQATLFDFSYSLASGDILAGTLEGTLLADNNTIEVDAFQDFVTFNGVPGPALPFVESFLEFTGAGIFTPTLTLDGSFMDLVACPSSSCPDGFIFGITAGPFGSSTNYIGGSSFGGGISGITETFNPANWTVARVPIPATLWLLMLGGVAMGVTARRRRTG